MHIKSEFSAPKANSIFARLQLTSLEMGDKRGSFEIKTAVLWKKIKLWSNSKSGQQKLFNSFIPDPFYFDCQPECTRMHICYTNAYLLRNRFLL